MEQHKKDVQFQIECLTQELIPMLMEDYKYSIPQAMEVLYRSKTFAKLEREATGLYYQGAVYIYDLLQEELTHTI